MNEPMVLGPFLVVAMVAAAPGAAQQSSGPDAATALVLQLEQAGAAGDAAGVVALGTAPDVPGIRAFADAVRSLPSRFVIKERDRAPRGAGLRLLLEVLAEFGAEAVITTWRVDVAPGSQPGAPARIEEMEQLTLISGLYRLSLNPAKQFSVRNLTVEAPDLRLHLPAGRAFVAEVDDGPTAVVLIGRGRMQFAPSDRAERTQVRIFAGEDTLDTEFDAAFVRVRPAEFDRTFDRGSLLPVAVNAADMRRATEVFEDHVSQTLHLDLTDLSRDRWSLVPSPGDLIAEIRTRGHGHLTYARSTKDAEDVSLFERRRRRNIAVYASAQKLASRGRFYSEDDLAEYDVLQYDIDAAFTPERLWVDGHARLQVRIRSAALTALTLRLADTLTVRSVTSPEHGRLLHFRVVAQNALIVNFPRSLTRDSELWLHVVYGGRLEPQEIDQEMVAAADQGPAPSRIQEQVYIPVEPHYLYSNRSYWYPQAPVTDYAVAQLRISVPEDAEVIATGVAGGPPRPAPDTVPPSGRPRKLFVFSAERPVRYLACLISRFEPVRSGTVAIPARPETVPAPPEPGPGPTAPSGDGQAEPASVALTVVSNPRQVARARSVFSRAASILEYYGSLVGDAPYSTFTIGVAESELPGGHSPPYFAILKQPLPMLPVVWRNDPVAFDDYQPYFLAHEIAHQWWGQAIGWKNYHEQWLSEGFSQYFAVLYAASDRGDGMLGSMLRQMRRWAMDQSAQGPIYLGYRLGHIRADGRVFRAILYNKGAMVLHMLRRLLGDEHFFGGVRLFYNDWKFRKAGTDDFRLAMEKVSGTDLRGFFDAWIYGSEIPELTFSSQIKGPRASIRFEHRGPVMPVPVTVSITYADGQTEQLVVPVTEKVVERVLPLAGTVRAIGVNRDHAALAEIDR